MTKKEIIRNLYERINQIDCLREECELALNGLDYETRQRNIQHYLGQRGGLRFAIEQLRKLEEFDPYEVVVEDDGSGNSILRNGTILRDAGAWEGK